MEMKNKDREDLHYLKEGCVFLSFKVLFNSDRVP